MKEENLIKDESYKSILDIYVEQIMILNLKFRIQNPKLHQKVNPTSKIQNPKFVVHPEPTTQNPKPIIQYSHIHQVSNVKCKDATPEWYKICWQPNTYFNKLKLKEI